ncbi:MAG: hypothetical protein L0H29_03605 [Sinobacteraceae bacterium]|nr:hypothetical protein [Nevskiaceae bacterium]
MKLRARSQRGIGLLEVLVTLLIISFGVLAQVSFQRFAFHQATLSNARASAARLAANKLEDLRSFYTLQDTGSGSTYKAIADNSGGSISCAGTQAAGCGPGVVVNNTTFSLQWTVKNYWYTAPNQAPITTAPAANPAGQVPLPSLKAVSGTVGWTDIDNKPQSYTLHSAIVGQSPDASDRIYR